MKSRLVFVFLFVFMLCLSAEAQQTQPTPIAVLSLSTRGDTSSDLAGLVSERVRSIVVQSRRYRVIEREAMDKILKEQGFQSTQNCQGNECAIQLGKLLSVKQLLTGSLSRLGSVHSLQLRVIDTETGTILNEAFVDCNCETQELVTQKLPATVAKVLSDPSLVTANPLAPPTEGPIRLTRPWLISVSADAVFPAKLNIQFNFNEYFAIYGAGGLGFSQSRPDLFPESDFTMAGGVRAYFNPHNWAGYADLGFGSNTTLNGLLGVEYRHPYGLTLGVGAGAFFNFRTTQFGFPPPQRPGTTFSSTLPYGALFQASAGYAF